MKPMNEIDLKKIQLQLSIIIFALGLIIANL